MFDVIAMPFIDIILYFILVISFDALDLVKYDEKGRSKFKVPVRFLVENMKAKN